MYNASELSHLHHDSVTTILSFSILAIPLETHAFTFSLSDSPLAVEVPGNKEKSRT